MGTVFRLDADELTALRPLVDPRGSDLARGPGGARISRLPLLPEIEMETAKQKETPTPWRHGQVSHRPCSWPVEITIEGDSLRLLLLERDALKALDIDWGAVGVYLLLGKPVTERAVLRVYVGKAQRLR